MKRNRKVWRANYDRQTLTTLGSKTSSTVLHRAEHTTVLHCTPKYRSIFGSAEYSEYSECSFELVRSITKTDAKTLLKVISV